MRLKAAPLLLGILIAAALSPAPARAQAGPPFLSNDPGTPGNGNWEINLAAVPIITRNYASYQLPQIDMNFGVGERIQLTYEIPYVVQMTSGQPQASGWGNANPGFKWRFLDQGESGWQLSTFPMYQTGVSSLAQQRGIGVAGPRYFLPIEAAHRAGPIALDFEAGYYVPVHGDRERIFGLVAGHTFSSGLELDAELYDDRVLEPSGLHTTTLDVGGRYKLGCGLIALFMAGRGVNGNASGQPQFFGYFGVQILLADYGLKFNCES